MQPPRFNMKLFLVIAIPFLLCALYLALTSLQDPEGSAKRLGML